MSNDRMRPCADPKVCGVQNHYDGTVCRARGGGLAGAHKLAPSKDGKGGVKPSVSIGGSQGKPEVNIRDSETKRSGHTFAHIEPDDESDELGVGVHDFEADRNGNWAISTPASSLEHAARSDEVFDDMDADDYKSFLRKEYPSANLHFNDRGMVTVKTSQKAEDFQGDITVESVNERFLEQNGQMLRDADSGKLDERAAEHAANLNEKREEYGRSTYIANPVPSHAVESEYEDANDDFTKSLQDVGVRAHHVRKGGGSSTVWLSRTDESGEEQTVVVPYHKGSELDPEPGVQEVVSAVLSDRDYLDSAPGDVSKKDASEIRSHFAGLNRVLGEHMDSVHESWQERDHDW